MDTSKLLGEQISENKLELSLKISNHLEEKYTAFLRKSSLADEAILNWRAQLIGYIGEALIQYNTKEVWEQVTNWARQTGEGAVQYGVAIDELLSTNKLYRVVIWGFVKENIDRDSTNVASFLQINDIIDELLDHTAYVFSVSFVEFHKRTLGLAKDAMLELSTPVVSLSDKIAILPLVGELDTYRARILMETSLQRCADLKNSELIIDLSGVPIVDTMVAQELFQVAKALQLIGVRPTFTGLRPDIAQTVVNLGIDFKEIRTTGSLKQALKDIGF